MPKLTWRAIVALIVAFAGSIWIYYWTKGFTSFTSYSYTLKQAGPPPRPLPALLIRDHTNRTFNFQDLKGDYVLFHIMYLKCPNVCPLMFPKIRKAYMELDPSIKRRLKILSLSIDPEHDTPELLKKVRNTMHLPDKWIMAVVAEPDYKEKLKKIGIWVFKRKDGLFNHTSSIFLINPDGNIIQTFSMRLSAEELKNNVEKTITASTSSSFISRLFHSGPSGR